MSQSETKTQDIYRSGRSHIINSALQMGPAKGKSQWKKPGLVTQKYNGLSSEGLWGSTGVGTGVRSINRSLGSLLSSTLVGERKQCLSWKEQG
jgi:hypothetical protein